jgi:mono/diheme cytochrome c family protein/glucose/arabinose dehydrogenase
MRLLLAFVLLAGQQGDKKGEDQPPLPSHIKVPPSPPLSPEKALETFKLAPGFRIELVAAEPLVEDPVCLQWDADGRIWVCEMLGYMPNVDGAGEEAPVGRVSVLEDADGDGRMDKRTTFLDRLVLPRAIALFADGVLVAEPPNLWFCRDKDGDLRCDEKTLVLPGYASVKVVEHTANGLLRAIDNWVYSANGKVRLRREKGAWVQGTTRSRGQWGLAQDDVGRLFYNTNPEWLRGDLAPCYNARAHAPKDPSGNVLLMKTQEVWPARVNAGVNRGYLKGVLRDDGRLAACTAACGPVVYRGDAYPDEFRGNVFACDPAANLVKRMILTEEAGTLSARNATEGTEFLTSTDERFRPANLYTGPDGCLYLVDFYRGVIQHRLYVTSFLRKQIQSRDLEKPLGMGRIWRIVHESRKPAPKLSKAAPAELVGQLSHANGWVRDAAQQLLVDRASVSAEGALRRLALSGPTVPRLHALFTLEGLGRLDAALLDACAKDADPRVRLAAESIREGSDPVGALVAAAAANPDLPAAALAVKELDILERLMASDEWEKEAPGRAALLGRIASRIAQEGKPERVAALLELVACQATAARWRQSALLDGLAALGSLELPSRSAPLVKLGFAEDESVRRRARALSARISWPGKGPEPEPPRAAPLGAEEQARWERGKRQYAASCAACHQLSGLGDDAKGPPLVDSEWVLGSEPRLLRIVLNGLQGPVHVNGTRHVFSQEMPAVLNMTNAEIAEVLTYVRREWGHQGAPVAPESVKAVRAKVEDREEPWTEKELLDLP